MDAVPSQPSVTIPAASAPTTAAAGTTAAGTNEAEDEEGDAEISEDDDDDDQNDSDDDDDEDDEEIGTKGGVQGTEKGCDGAPQVVHVPPPAQPPTTPALFTHCQYAYIGVGRWQVYVQMWFVEDRLKREVSGSYWHGCRLGDVIAPMYFKCLIDWSRKFFFVKFSHLLKIPQITDHFGACSFPAKGLASLLCFSVIWRAITFFSGSMK